MKKKSSSSSESPPPFLSLPHDIVFNTLARISRTNYPTLSLVSKSFRSLLSSPGLEAARSLIGRPEKYLHVCLNLNNKLNPNPSWFILNSQRELIPTPSFPYQHLQSSSVVSTGSETYIIGGEELVANGRKNRSKSVFLIDFKTHQWRKLPNMRVSRKEAVVKVMDGKIYVTGGSSSSYPAENYGEVYDPITQTWEPISSTTLDLPHQNGYYSSTTCFVDRGFSGSTKPSLVLTEKKFWLVVRDGELRCGGVYWWTSVQGLEAISSNYLLSVTNSGQDKRVIVWWKTDYAEECETEIWCAQILIGIWNHKTVDGFIEWSENVFTFQGCNHSDDDSDDDSEFLLHSALVTHDY